MSETFQRPQDTAVWQAALDGEPVDWAGFLRPWRAVVDWPSATFWREIAAAHPQSPVLLSTRASSEEWWRSFRATVVDQLRTPVPPGEPEWSARRTMVVGVVRARARPGLGRPRRRGGRLRALQRRRARGDRAGAAVEWTPADGWGPLCRALGKLEPDEPFPHTNTTADFQARQTARKDRPAVTPQPVAETEDVVSSIAFTPWALPRLRRWGSVRRIAPTAPDSPADPDSTREDARLVAALRAGDEQAFRELIERYQPAFVRTAKVYVRDQAVAEEVAQETWLAVLQGLDRFEGRSSLKTWMFRILTNRAITRAKRERRSTPFSALRADDGPAVDPDRFLPPDDPEWPGHWRAGPSPWSDLPEQVLLSGETRAKVLEAIEQLPDSQRQVITLRDVEGFSGDEVRDLLDLTDVNQRVLLHRARSRVRALLEPYFKEVAA